VQVIAWRTVSEMTCNVSSVKPYSLTHSVTVADCRVRFCTVSYCGNTRRVSVGAKNGNLAVYDLKQSKCQVRHVILLSLLGGGVTAPISSRKLHMRRGSNDACTVCMSSFLETDVRTVVLHTLSKRLTPVMMWYALVA